MTTSITPRERAADLQLGGLRVWIDGRHATDSNDYWDGNWLVVCAHYQSAQSQVSVAGPLLHVSEVVTLHSGCTRLAAGEVQEAGLYCMEPNLKIELWAVPGGKFIGKVRITPDHKSEMHDFGFALADAELDALLASCAELLQRYPLRNRPSVANDEGGAAPAG